MTNKEKKENLKLKYIVRIKVKMHEKQNIEREKKEQIKDTKIKHKYKKKDQ